MPCPARSAASGGGGAASNQSSPGLSSTMGRPIRARGRPAQAAAAPAQRPLGSGSWAGGREACAARHRAPGSGPSSSPSTETHLDL